jgi:hypothetical protein
MALLPTRCATDLAHRPQAHECHVSSGPAGHRHHGRELAGTAIMVIRGLYLSNRDRSRPILGAGAQLFNNVLAGFGGCDFLRERMEIGDRFHAAAREESRLMRELVVPRFY